MYNNLDEWLSPSSISSQRPAAAAAAADDDDDDDDECLSEERACNSSAGQQNAVVNSHIITVSTSSSSSRTVDLVEPITLTLSHIHVCRHFHLYSLDVTTYRRSQGVQWVHLHPPGRRTIFFQA